MYDIMDNVPNKKIDCLDYGHVTLVDVMPRLCPEGQTADYAIVQAARVSYGAGTKTINEDRGLIRYLMRHKHTTPLEMVEFKFHCKMPMFVARQWVRHRMASINEYSARYSIVPDQFYIPGNDNVRQQSKTNKQGGEQQVDASVADNFVEMVGDVSKTTYDLYEKCISEGIAREQSRMILPINAYTEWYWKIDLHNLLHFLGLRCDSHAQYEIRVFGDAIRTLITPIVPTTMEAWEDYNDHRQAIRLTRLEVEALKRAAGKVGKIESENKREQEEWLAKAAKLGLSVE